MNKEVSIIFRSPLSRIPSIHDLLFGGSRPGIFGGSVVRLQVSSSHVGHAQLYDYAFAEAAEMSKLLVILRFSADTLPEKSGRYNFLVELCQGYPLS
jgi:hypothetical protein